MGSLRESALLMLLVRKDQIEHSATRLLTQAQVNAEAAPKAFDEYVKLRYPYLETAKKREKDEAISQLMAEVKKGPLKITPLGDTAVKSRTYRKISREQVPTTEEANAVGSRLMGKIGRSIPL